MKYTKQYFIDKFQAIPSQEWCEGELTNEFDENCHCALGHCGVINYKATTDEAYELSKLLMPVYDKLFDEEFTQPCNFHTFEINDESSSLGDTPKQRILNALNLVPNETP